ncbi:MAG: glycogen/starch/alpha-glucan phosphorylase [Firmicutes bacterium]|nr:glycogen/starch/alpha-glucan phosphorylase [Bacillota bacterium]
MSLAKFKDKETFKEAYKDILDRTYSKPADECTDWEKYEALVYLINQEADASRKATKKAHNAIEDKRVYYFSMEFLIGKLLENYLLTAGIKDSVKDGLRDLGVELDALLELDPEPGLGNGGLGRLAACFLDSMASLGIAGTGMGIRYRFGLFRQKIENGWQVAEPDAWLANGYPWEEAVPADSVEVRFGGVVDRSIKDGHLHFTHRDYTAVRAIPYNVNIIGAGGEKVERLKLWSASLADDTLDMDAFNRGEYSEALKKSAEIEAINCILYPDDSMGAGRRLRLMQEYFFVAAGIATIIRNYKKTYGPDALDKLPDRVAIHINDTHPTLCVPELMRVLMDVEGMEWDDAWNITERTVSFTNHTVLPEALEKWPISLMQSLLPRVYMIIEEIDRRWREKVESMGRGGYETMRSTAVLWDGEVRMANLSIIGSHSTNGVAALHSQILKDDVFRAFYEIKPEAFGNKTNGVSHRRFLVQADPGLAELITSAIGDKWIRDPQRLEDLLKYKDDSAFLERLAAVKRYNKVKLSDYLIRNGGPSIDPDSIMDVHVKRIHAYKRQLLNVLKIMDLYNRLCDNPFMDMEPVTFIFAGKAAQGYGFAKDVIKLINSVAEIVNADPVISQKIKVVFAENFCVSLGQIIYPAADISEQISTAGKEASGTGNMKFMMNGAVTLGTLDGANIEIKEQVGDDNIKIFGLTSDEVMNYYRYGGYNAYQTANDDPRLKKITSQLVDGFFERCGTAFWTILDDLVKHNDSFFVLKDFDSYVRAWNELTAAHKDRDAWNRMSLVNIAKSGFFSSDRTIKEYAEDIWNIRK